MVLACLDACLQSMTPARLPAAREGGDVRKPRTTRRRRGRRARLGVVAGLAALGLAACDYGEATHATEVTDVSARLHGNVHSSDPLPQVWFEYDAQPEVVDGALVFDASTPIQQWACCGPMETASSVVSGLEPGTTYHYRMCVRTESGGGLCGAPVQLTTKPDDRDVVEGHLAIPIYPELGYVDGVSVSVRAEPDSSDPVGAASRSPGTHYFRLADTGSVTCLHIVGNRAAIGFVADYEDFGAPDVPVVVYVEDNGDGGDRFADTTLTEPPVDCPDPATAAVDWRLAAQGDITIVDHPVS